MYYDEEYNSDTLLKENVDFYLKRAHNENMLYKVKEILGETYNHDIICLSRLIELEGILGFGIRKYMLSPKHAGRPKKPYTEKAQSKAIRVIGSIADQVKTINDFIREHPYEEDRVKFLLSSVIEQLK